MAPQAWVSNATPFINLLSSSKTFSIQPRRAYFVFPFRCPVATPVASAARPASSQKSTPSSSRTILVIGGTGFVGQAYISQHLALHPSDTVVSISRRGAPPDADRRVVWVSGNAADPATLENAAATYGPFNGCVHAAGVLLDGSSGLAALNRIASGSGTRAGGPGSASYDEATRLTAFSAIDIMEEMAANLSTEELLPFVFVSAAEAGWTVRAPIAWLERYLIAKRAVEARLLAAGGLRGIVLRPSLVWTMERPQALFSVVPFTILNALCVPGVDRPVKVETLVTSAIRAIDDPGVKGVLRYTEMEALAR